MLQPLWDARTCVRIERRARKLAGAVAMRIGMVCPYSFDVPGGVQAHVVELAQVLIERGHKVSVLAPGVRRHELPEFVVSAGKAVAIPYNGSVARLTFGPRPTPGLATLDRATTTSTSCTSTNQTPRASRCWR